MASHAKTKETVDSLAMSAQSVSFCIPEAGPFVAAFFAAGQALFDTFFPDDPLPDPKPDNSVTLDDLTDAVQTLATIIKNQQLTGKFDEVTALNYKLKVRWPIAKRGLMNAADVAVDKQAKTLEGWQDFGGAFKDTFNDLVDPITQLLQAASHHDTRFQGLHPYIYAANTYLLLGKCCLMWEYAEAVRAHHEEQAKAAEKKAAAGDTAPKSKLEKAKEWMRQHNAKTEKPPKEVREAVAKLLPRSTIASASVYVAAIKANIANYRKHVEDVLADMEAPYKAYTKRFLTTERGLISTVIMRTRGKKPVIHEYIQSSLGDGAYESDTTNEDLKDAHFNLVAAAYEPQIWQEEIVDKGMDSYTKAYRDRLREIISAWKEVERNTAAFMDKYQKDDGRDVVES